MGLRSNKINYVFWFLSFVIFLVAACVSDQDDSQLASQLNQEVLGENIHLFSSEPPGSLPLDSIVEEVDYLYLKENFYLKDIFSARFHEEYILLVNSRKEEAFVYNSEGKGLYQVGKNGKGPGEYFNIESIEFNPFTNTVDLISVYPSRIMQFDVSSGKHMKDIPLFETPEYSYFAPINETSYLVNIVRFSKAYPDITDHFVVFNGESQEIEGSYLAYSEFQQDDWVEILAPYASRLSFSRVGRTLFGSYFNDPSIYSYSSEGFQKAYTLEFGKTYAHDLLIDGKFEFDRVYTEGSICCLDPLVVTDSYIYGTYSYKDFKGNGVFLLKKKWQNDRI